MRKPLPSRALCRLLLLAAAGVAGTTTAQAQIMNMPVMPPRATSPADTARATAGTPPDQSATPPVTVFTPSVTDENGEPLQGVTLANAGGAFTALTDSLGHAMMPEVKAGETLTVSIEGSVIRRYTANGDLISHQQPDDQQHDRKCWMRKDPFHQRVLSRTAVM